jgi:catabolite regulation protein CreA
MNEVWLNSEIQKISRLFDHENNAYLYLFWIPQKWAGSFEIWQAG